MSSVNGIKKLSIIIPAYNEAKTIRKVVEKVLATAFPVEFEIILVDDHSEDRTFKIAQLLNERLPQHPVVILRNEVNRGKGYSIRRGMQSATGDAIIIQDADFEYEPSDIPALLAPMLRDGAQVVFGSRFYGRFWPKGMALPNMVANRFLTVLTNLLFGCRLTDMETCYKLIRRDALSGIELSTQRFDFEPEITCKLVKKGVRIVERPIGYAGRTASEGKKIKARDFFIAIRVLFQNRFCQKTA